MSALTSHAYFVARRSRATYPFTVALVKHTPSRRLRLDDAAFRAAARTIEREHPGTPRRQIDARVAAYMARGRT